MDYSDSGGASAGTGGKTVIYPIQGEGSFFVWQANGVETQDNYGIHLTNSRLYEYDRNGGTTPTDLGTQFTVISLTRGHVSANEFTYNNTKGWAFYPKYVNTSGNVVHLTNSTHNNDPANDYNFQVHRVDGNILTQIMDTSKQDVDGSTIEDFAS